MIPTTDQLATRFGWPNTGPFAWPDELVISPDGRDQPLGPVLLPVAKRPRTRIVQPLDEPTLFETFATLEPTDPAALLRFANQYGGLTYGWATARPPLAPTEPRIFWVQQIRAAAASWKVWTERPALAPPPPALVVEVNDRLRKQSCAALTVSTRDLDDGGEPRLRLRVHPINLLGALWLLFARVIDEQRAYPQCPICRERFEVARVRGAGGRRSDATYCSNNKCRQKAYRDNKKARQRAATRPTRRNA